MAALRRKRDELASVIELLLEEGSDPSCRQGSTGPKSEVSGEAAMQVRNEKNSSFQLLKSSCFFVARKQVGWSLLHHLARVGDHTRLLWFLHQGAEVDPVDRTGTTPLFIAAAKVT